MQNKKLSLSIINSLLLLLFFIILTTAVLFSSYMNTQKVVDKNISDYFNQTFNITKLIIENEQKSLQEIVTNVTNEFKSISQLDNQYEVTYKLETLSYNLNRKSQFVISYIKTFLYLETMIYFLFF